MLEKIDIRPLSVEAWLATRIKTVGGSEISAILGMNPFQSAYTLWCEKTGRKAPFEGNLATEVGTVLEKFVADKFSEISGMDKRVQQTGFLYRNDKYPVLHASPDRLIHATTGSKSKVIAGLECKTTSAWNTSKFRGTDFPTQYYAQCVQYMAVMEVPVWYLAVLVGNHEFHVYKLILEGHNQPAEDWVEGTVTVDNDEIVSLNEAATEFMDCVKKDVPPVIDGSESSSQMLNERYPESNGENIFDPTIEFTCRQLQDIGKQAKELEKKKKELENALKDRMGESEQMTCPGWCVKWKSVPRTAVDSAALKKELPDIYEIYAKTTVSRRFELKEDI